MRRNHTQQSNWRAEKRAMRKMGMDDHVYYAHLQGEDDAYHNKPYRNPYPPGRRHDHYKRSYHTADPLGDWHGRNK